ASIPTTSVVANPFPGLLALEECPTRLQRASSPARTKRIRAVGVSPVWSVRAGEGDEAEPCGGGTGLGTRGERALVEKLSMSGAQFLDLVNTCEVLEGRFSWAAGASVIHRVTREGRNRKTARSLEILGCSGAHGSVNTSPKTEDTDREPSGRNTTRRCRPSSAANGNPRRPQIKRGQQAPRKGRSGHRSGENPTNGGRALAAAEASGLSGAAMGDDVRGGGSDQSGGAAAAAAAGTTSESGNNTSDCQAGVNQHNEIGKLHEMPKKPSKDGHVDGKDGETESLSKEAAFLKPRAPQDNQLVSVGLPLAHHRLRFAFEQHLLPEVLNTSRASTRQADREISDIMEALDSRLTLREACRICTAVTGFVAIACPARQQATTRRRQGEENGLSGHPEREEKEEEALLSIGDDSMDPEEFSRVIFHCGDLKTWDGLCPVSQRVGLFVVHDLYERFLERTGEASLWWTRDGAMLH
ncbi:unnamed protein product, partial [Ectocarpus sp. 12 AP-2014]